MLSAFSKSKSATITSSNGPAFPSTSPQGLTTLLWPQGTYPLYFEEKIGLDDDTRYIADAAILEEDPNIGITGIDGGDVEELHDDAAAAEPEGDVDIRGGGDVVVGGGDDQMNTSGGGGEVRTAPAGVEKPLRSSLMTTIPKLRRSCSKSSIIGRLRIKK